MPKANATEAAQPLGASAKTETEAPQISNHEADQMAANSGYVFDLELTYFTQYTREELEAQGYTKTDVARAARVLKLAGLEIPSKPVERTGAARIEQPEG